MPDLLALSASQQAQLIASGQLSPLELMQHTLARVDSANAGLGAIVTLRGDEALADAAAATDTMPADPPPLYGVPFTVKDTIEVAGVRCTAGSLLLDDYVPAETAPVVQAVLAAGAILIGKTNCPEFGVGNSDTWNLRFGQTRNPRDVRFSPGGSSGGEAAAVGAGLSAFGVGVDYGGSVRVPAHCVGVAGLRPTPGRLSGEGIVPHWTHLTGGSPVSRLARSLTTPGFLARSVEDLRVLLALTGGAGAGVRALPRSCAWFIGGADSDVAAAVAAAAAALATAGLVVEQMTPPNFFQAADLMGALRRAEGAPEVADLARGQYHELTPLWRDELSRPPASAGPGSLAELERLRDGVDRFMANWPVLLLPVAISAAFPASDGPPPPRPGFEDPCRAVTALRLASLSVPCGTSATGLPIGVQVVGPPGSDATVLAVAAVLERAFGPWKQPTGVTLR